MAGKVNDGLRFFWGKARPAGQAEDVTAPTHPLVAHMLDVAAVAVLWPGSSRLGLDRRQLGLLVALHDMGKVTPAFQAKVPAHWPRQALGPLPDTVVDSRHDVDGLILLDRVCADVLAPLFGADADGLEWEADDKAQLWRAVAGHHGQPVAIDETRARTLGHAACAAHARELAGLLLDVFRPPPIPVPSLDQLRQLEWQLAGVTVVTDWIGSRQDWFPYVQPDDVADAAGYFWNHALPRAQHALARAGLGPVTVAPFRGIGHLFAHVQVPSPVQALLEEIALPAGPALVVIEDMTGSGKTEAALVVAHRLMASGRATGLFVALPTMATANAMFDRIAAAYRGLFQPSAHPSLALAHGRALLDPRFAAVVAPDDALDAAAVPQARMEAAEVSCAAWLAGESRRALLAQVGVGTIDQALMAVLPVRFATIRQAGLAGKVLLVDECHAYDPYMQAEMAALLRFHASMGGSAILLSATLTKAVRQKLVAAFRAGLQQEAPVSLSSTAYPLVTLVGCDGMTEQPCAPRPGLARRIAVRQSGSEAAVMVDVVAAAGQGAAVAWVRNTVDDVIATARALAQQGVEAQVFHARFAMIDRLAIERDVLARFGRNSMPADRAGVLVASQVIEQSLDLDFDVLCTDLAPMDLIIQRAGRLRRHQRAARPIDRDEICVLAPAPVDDPDPEWIRRLLPGTAAVYRDPALLWRTARALLRMGTIESPGNVRDLIEAAGDTSITPEGLATASSVATGHGLAAHDAARRNILHHEWGYTPGSGLWEPDIRTPTRLEERPYVTVRLGVLRAGQVWPWAALKDETLAAAHAHRRAWALSEVSVAQGRLASCHVAEDAREAVATARAGWSRWEREADDRFLLLLLTEVEGGAEGRGHNAKGHAVVVRYDNRYGLEVVPAPAG
ncbi:CRISPR-associated helicase Cas3' [Komagataeibacter melomenusus]|uniref:CRISPR-associated helicase Cas3' n=1 Tax=Komagataeibacter melomenusus TaxID=2766578 RepID=UPI0023EECCC8